MKKHLYFMDLFAGCGGLSLGLEKSGFIPAYVNELDPQTMESYLVNRDDKYPLLRKKYHSNDIRSISKESTISKIKVGFKNDYGITRGDLGIIAGGPPCQGFSHIGHRRSYRVERRDLPSNHLYKEMIWVIKQFKPKCFVFENVGGLLFGKWTFSGQKGEIWEDVKKSFESIPDYVVRSALVRAKWYGVPQNRPRIIMIGLRKDIRFELDDTLPAGGLLPNPTNNYPHLVDLLGDLVDRTYISKSRTSSYPSEPKTRIQKIFRSKKNGTGWSHKGDLLTEHEYSKHSERIRKKFAYMIKHNGAIPSHMKTKKFSQKILPRFWKKDGPNITVTSLPDDYVHYCQPRILTVREWARMQTFPDWYQFVGKRTTGGIRRGGNPRKGIWDREVPKYTQIGNAVPVDMASVIGKHLFNIIS